MEEKSIQDEVARRMEAEIQRRVQQQLSSDAFQRALHEQLEAERKRLEAAMHAEIEAEKRRILDEWRRKEEEKERSAKDLETLMAENE